MPIWKADAEPVEPIRPPSSHYLAVLEQETPPGLRAMPHLRWKDSPFDLLDELAAHLGWTSDIPLHRQGPPDSSEQVAVVRSLPRELLPKLAALSDDAIRDIAVEIENALDADELGQLELLLGLRDLAKVAIAGDGELCLFVTL